MRNCDWKPKITVCIVDYKKPEFTKTCIESIKKTSYWICGIGSGIEILVYDNSIDNIGLAAASNELARQAIGEYLFFLNNDTIVKRDIFDNLLKSGYDIVGCKMYNYSGKMELDSGISLDRFGAPAGKTGPTFYVDGALFMKKSVFDDIGGFDEKLFLYGEDRDLCWRAWLAGYRVGISHLAVFYHNSNSVCSTNYYQRYHSEKNIIRSMLKNFSLKTLSKRSLQYALLSIPELILMLFIKPSAVFKSYIPAYAWNIRYLLDTLRERKKIKKRISDNDLPFSREIGKLWVLRNIGIPKWRGK